MISRVDWLVVASYVALLVANGLRWSRLNTTPEDYFLAARAARWPTIGLALIASNISSTALVGLAGAAFATGISAYNYEWMAVLVLVFFCIFLLPQLLHSRVFTMPEFLERRYDGRARRWFTLLTLFLNVFVDGAGALYSGALVCRALIPGAPLWLLSCVLAGAAGIYTIIGGLRAVLRTEVIQATVLISGAALVSWTALARAGGWHAVMTQVDPAALSLIRPAGDAAVPWPGLLAGVPLLGFYYWCTNQMIVQRTLSARDLDHGRSGVLLAGLLKLPVLFLMVLPGTCALLLFPGVAHADLVYPTLIVGLLPAGLVGLLVAGFVAATMTAVASMLNSASALITMDMARRAGPGRGNARTVTIGRISTGACLLVAMLWAPQLERMPSLWQYLQAVLAYAVPPVVALFLSGLFWRGASAAGAYATCVLGTFLGAFMFLLNVVLRVTHLHFLYVAPLLFAADVVILVVASRRGARAAPGAGAALEALHWSRNAFAAETVRLAAVPWWRNYRLQSLVLLALTAWIVIAFR
ncbi:MAG: sodium/solute symporter [Gammaproteobacteria bacterium]|nr:sodium/solute symporter [Gammaproteobacteria bacterium]